jgi:flagellin
MATLGQINTNIAALKSYNQLTHVNDQLAIHQERISTGKKISSAADDPAGYYIARVYEREISVLNRNAAHVDNASAQLQLEDSKMAQIVGILQDVEDLTLQAKSDLVSTAQKSALKSEIDQLITEIKDIAGGLTKLSGINVGAGLSVSVATTTVSNTGGGIGLMSGSSTVRISVSSAGYISNSLSILSAAITTMLNREEQIGAYITRLQAKGDAYTVDLVNKESQKSVIEDADLAQEQLSVTKYQILQQSALAMLAQANASPQSVLQLITG